VFLFPRRGLVKKCRRVIGNLRQRRKAQPGQTVECIITDSESPVPNDRVRAFALCEGWFRYDRKKYAGMLPEAFEPFVPCIPKTVQVNVLQDSLFEEELKRFPLFAALAFLRPLRV
jgi:hypothetical protein